MRIRDMDKDEASFSISVFDVDDAGKGDAYLQGELNTKHCTYRKAPHGDYYYLVKKE